MRRSIRQMLQPNYYSMNPMRPGSRLFFLFVGTVVATTLLPTVRGQLVNSRAGPCPTDPTVTGYTNIADINQDQFDEFARITAGSTDADPPYSFVLCPNTLFDASKENLKVVLSGSVISCGSDMAASSTLGCHFQGGASQVYLQDSTNPHYKLAMATIIGVTFEKFNGTSIDILASETLTLTLMDVVWKNFFSDFVIRQQRAIDGIFPARVDLVGGVVDNGMGGSLFSNDAGVLVLDQLTVANITCAGLVSTSNGGVVMMQSSMVSRSVIDTVASATMGSTLSVMDVDVFDLVFTKSVFQASDAGSALLLNRTKIRDIKNEGEWSGVAVDSSADAKLQQVEFNQNGHFESLVDGRNSAKLEMVDCIFERNFGLGAGAASAVVFVDSSSAASMSRTKFIENTQLRAIALASKQSALNIEQSCFMGGSSDEVVFRSSDSATTLSENYVDMTIDSTTCPGGNVRLSVEKAGSQCYQKGSTTGCTSTCDTLGDQPFCVADLRVKLAPGDANTTMGEVGNMTADGGVAADQPFGDSPGVNGTAPPTSPGNDTDPSATVAPTSGNETDQAPDGGETELTTRIDVRFRVENDMLITDPAEVNASGLGEAFPVYVEELVANLTETARRQLFIQQRRRLEISLIAGSAFINEIIVVPCEPDSRQGNVTMDPNMTLPTNPDNTTMQPETMAPETMPPETMQPESNETTCHEAMGKYDLLLSEDEDPIAVRTTYTRATRAGIDDGTFQKVLLEVNPSSPLIVGPSLNTQLPSAAPSVSPASGPPNTLFPTFTKPTCPPLSARSSKSKAKSKSKSKSKAKGAKGSGGYYKQSKGGRKMMRKHRPRTHGGGRNHHHHGHNHHRFGRKLHEHHITHEHTTHATEDMETAHFENVLREHDDGDYYIYEEEEEEEEGVGYLDGDLEEIVADECEEPEDYYLSSSKGSKGRSKRSKGSSYYYYEETSQHYSDEESHRRELLVPEDPLPRIHGASHRISDMRAVLSAELEEDSE